MTPATGSTTRQLALRILQHIDNTGDYVDHALERFLDETTFDDRDRRLIHEIVNGVVKQRKQIRWILSRLFKGKYEKAPHIVRLALETAVYQLNFLSRVPSYAVVHEAVAVVKKRAGTYWGNKVNAILRTYQRQAKSLQAPAGSQSNVELMALKYSHPEWLIERWIEQLGVPATELLCQANNKTPDVTCRINLQRASREEVLHYFHDCGIVATPGRFTRESVILHQPGDIKHISIFNDGIITIQDESATLVSHLMDPRPGEIIYDLCAAPGGKTTHIAELMQDRGMVVAIDLNRRRLQRVEENRRRLRLESIRLVQADALTFRATPADRVLLDVPCSGLGVLAKRADLRWNRRKDDITELVALQQRLLNHASKLVRSGGVLVYSTCTIEPAENQQVIEQFLAAHSEFVIENPNRWLTPHVINENKYLSTYPHVHHIDGAFAVRLRKET